MTTFQFVFLPEGRPQSFYIYGPLLNWKVAGWNLSVTAVRRRGKRLTEVFGELQDQIQNFYCRPSVTVLVKFIAERSRKGDTEFFTRKRYLGPFSKLIHDG